jgi:hypothetical protein
LFIGHDCGTGVVTCDNGKVEILLKMGEVGTGVKGVVEGNLEKRSQLFAVEVLDFANHSHEDTFEEEGRRVCCDLPIPL